MNIRIIAATVLTISLVSCGSAEKESDKKSDKPADKEAVQDCFYEYDATATHMEWEAFKYITPTGVVGSFNNVLITNTERANSIQDVFTNASFIIPVASVNSNNPDRDGKIQEHFFGTLVNTDTIAGKLTKWEGETGAFQVTMNGITKEIPVTIIIKEDSVLMNGTVEMKDFDGMSAINALNTICKELHTEPGDTESKLWSNVDIRLATKLKKECN